MKINKYYIVRCLVIAICALPLMSVGCDNKDDDVSGGGGGGSDDYQPSLANYIDINITRCERVGSVLQIDYTVTNKKNFDIEITFGDAEGFDDKGTLYRTDLAFGNNNYSNWRANTKIAGNKRIEGHAKLLDFDITNSAITAKLKLWVEIAQVGSYTFERSNINITDNRVLAHGIQTNDLNLQWTLNSCKRDTEGNVIVEFTLRNNTGGKLNDFGIGFNYGDVYDNFGTKYSCGFRWGTNGNYNYDGLTYNNSTNISLGGSAVGSISIEKVSSAATEVSVELRVDVRDYIMNDYKVRFLTIPIQ